MDAMRRKNLKRLAELYCEGVPLVAIAGQVGSSVASLQRELRKVHDANLAAQSGDEGRHAELIKNDIAEGSLGERDSAETVECCRLRCCYLGTVVNAEAKNREPRPHWLPAAIVGHWSPKRNQIASDLAASLELVAAEQ